MPVLPDSGTSEGRGQGSIFSIKIPTEEFAKKNNINQQPIEPTKPSQPANLSQAK